MFTGVWDGEGGGAVGFFLLTQTGGHLNKKTLIWQKYHETPLIFVGENPKRAHKGGK